MIKIKVGKTGAVCAGAAQDARIIKSITYIATLEKVLRICVDVVRRWRVINKSFGSIVLRGLSNLCWCVVV